MLLIYTIKRKETQRFDKSRICSDHSRSATLIELGPGHSQPRQVSSKSVQGFWLPEGSKFAIFLCVVLWLI